jgi:GNAT superfamily N-acetyltransferase
MMPTISRAGVEVRDAGRSELPEVRRVLLGAYQEYAEALPPAVFGRYLTDILDVEGRVGAGRVLVASHGGRVVGTVTFYADAGLEGFGWPAGWAGLRALGVEPSARGAGVGQALVEACLERARADGAPMLRLHTAEFLTAAVAIYERLGFRRDPAFDFDGTAAWAWTAFGPSPSWPTGLTLPGPIGTRRRRAPRRSGSARCTTTRSPGSAGSCASPPR